MLIINFADDYIYTRFADLNRIVSYKLAKYIHDWRPARVQVYRITSNIAYWQLFAYLIEPFWLKFCCFKNRFRLPWHAYSRMMPNGSSFRQSPTSLAMLGSFRVNNFSTSFLNCLLNRIQDWKDNINALTRVSRTSILTFPSQMLQTVSSSYYDGSIPGNDTFHWIFSRPGTLKFWNRLKTRQMTSYQSIVKRSAQTA